MDSYQPPQPPPRLLPGQRILSDLITTIQDWGWHAVFLLIVAYNLRPIITRHLDDRARKESLRHANDPERVAVLDVDRRRARLEQLERLAELRLRPRMP